MRSKTICFSGHREIKDESYQNIYTNLLNTVRSLAEEGYTEFIAGGAYGFDMMAELAVLEIRREMPFIKLHLIIPYHGHDNAWDSTYKSLFSRIEKMADSVEYLYDRYTKWSYAERNRKMVEKSSVLVYFLNKQKSGTANTLRYAQKYGLKLMKIAE